LPLPVASGRLQTRIVIQAVLGGDLSDYGDAERAQMGEQMADALGVNRTAVRVTLTSGSVNADFTILLPREDDGRTDGRTDGDGASSGGEAGVQTVLATLANLTSSTSLLSGVIGARVEQVAPPVIDVVMTLGPLQPVPQPPPLPTPPLSADQGVHSPQGLSGEGSTDTTVMLLVGSVGAVVISVLLGGALVYFCRRRESAPKLARPEWRRVMRPSPPAGSRTATAAPVRVANTSVSVASYTYANAVDLSLPVDVYRKSAMPAEVYEKPETPPVQMHDKEVFYM